MLHLEDFFGLATCLRRNLSTLCGVDVVHRVLHLAVRDDVRDQRGEDVEAEAAHDGVELDLDGDRDAGLLLEGLVQRELGHVAEDRVEDEALNLLLRRGELVEGVGDLVVQHLVLHADGNLHEDVVAGLGLHLELRLLDLQVDEVDALREREEEVQPRARDAVELAEAFDDTGGISAHGVVGLGDEYQEEDTDEEDSSE